MSQCNPSDSRGKRLLESEPSLDALELQITATSISQPWEKIKDTILSIVCILNSDREKTIYLFMNRVIDLSINILMLLEVTQDLPHITMEKFHQVLESVKMFVVLANRWKSHPYSKHALRKILSTKSHNFEHRIASILVSLQASLSNTQTETPMWESTNQFCDNASSNLFSNASNFTMNNPQFYTVPGGSVHFGSNNFESGQTTGHPDFPGLPTYEDLELEKELYKGREYRIHRGRARGRAVAVKVFEGPSAKRLCLQAAEFNRSVMHPNILQMIGGPSRDSGSSFLVFDGDYQGTVESQLPIALKEGIKEGCVMGANTVIACSLGLDYLQQCGLGFPIMKPEHFVLMVSKQGRIVLNFDADTTWDHGASIHNLNRSEISQSEKAMRICNELIQRTFYASCKEYYQDQRIYDDQLFLENADGSDQPEDEIERHLPWHGRDAPRRDSMNRKPPQKSKGHRRELVWKTQSGASCSLAETGQQYQASLARFQSEDVLVHRRGYSVKQIAAHRCPGYKRTEIVLTPDIERSGIVSHVSPLPNEICSVCGDKVKIEEIFDCVCGLPENYADNSQPTVRCIICNRWQHQKCMKISTEMQIKHFICWRCPRNLRRLMVDPFNRGEPTSNYRRVNRAMAPGNGLGYGIAGSLEWRPSQTEWPRSRQELQQRIATESASPFAPLNSRVSQHPMLPNFEGGMLQQQHVPSPGVQRQLELMLQPQHVPPPAVQRQLELMQLMQHQPQQHQDNPEALSQPAMDPRVWQQIQQMQQQFRAPGAADMSVNIAQLAEMLKRTQTRLQNQAARARLQQQQQQQQQQQGRHTE